MVKATVTAVCIICLLCLSTVVLEIIADIKLRFLQFSCKMRFLNNVIFFSDKIQDSLKA